MKKILVFLTVAALSVSLLCVSVFASPDSATENSDVYYQPKDSSWPKAPKIVSPAAILMDASTGTILYGKNIDDKHYPASTTKILTSIIALENSNLNETVKFSHNAIYSLEEGSTHIGINEGEKLSMKDCLYGLLLASANEVANGIAEHISGSTDKFAELMNEYAKNIGCTNSHFANPSGLHNDEHYTTCHDLALIAQYAFKNPTFREIDGTSTYTIGKTNLTNEKRTFTNHHQMLVGNKEGFTQFKYDGCIGGKTGYTSKADHTLVTFAKRDNTTLIVVVMDTSVTDQYQDSWNLLDYGFDNFTSYNISKNENSTTLYNENSNLFNRYFNIANSKDSISINSSDSIIIPSSIEFSDIKKNIDFIDDVTLIEGENKIGTITYSYGDIVVGSADITFNCSKESLTPILSMPEELVSSTQETPVEAKTPLKDTFFKILKIAGIVIGSILVIGIIFLVIRHMVWRRKKRGYLNRRSRFKY